MKSYSLNRLVLVAAMVTALVHGILGCATEAHVQFGSSFTFVGGVATSWMNSANWINGPANKAPGVDNNPNSLIDGSPSDIAVVQNVLTFNQLNNANLGINMGYSSNSGIGNETGANGSLTLGAIYLNQTTYPPTFPPFQGALEFSTLPPRRETPAFCSSTGIPAAPSSR